MQNNTLSNKIKRRDLNSKTFLNWPRIECLLINLQKLPGNEWNHSIENYRGWNTVCQQPSRVIYL